MAVTILGRSGMASPVAWAPPVDGDVLLVAKDGHVYYRVVAGPESPWPPRPDDFTGVTPAGWTLYGVGAGEDSLWYEDGWMHLRGVEVPS